MLSEPSNPAIEAAADEPAVRERNASIAQGPMPLVWAADRMLKAAHNEGLGIERSVCLRDVRDRLAKALREDGYEVEDVDGFADNFVECEFGVQR